MNKKRTNVVNVNFILILSIILVVVTFVLSNYFKFDKGEALLNELDNTVTSSSMEDDESGTFEEWGVILSEFGLDAGIFGLNVLRVLFVWIPLFHVAFLLLFAGISWTLFRPTPQRVIAYRVLMTFAYLNIILMIIVLVIGIIIHPSTIKKIKMSVFLVQCLSILIWNFSMTYSCKIKSNVFKNRKNSSYDKDNQIPVIRASICTGEKVAGFKDLHTGKFEEVMLVKDDKDMQRFLMQYDVEAKDVKKEW